MCKYFLSGSHLYSVLEIPYLPLPRMWPILVPSGTFKDASYAVTWLVECGISCPRINATHPEKFLRKALVKKEELPTLIHSMNKRLLSTYSLHGDKWDTGSDPMKGTVLFTNNYIFTSIPPHLSAIQSFHFNEISQGRGMMLVIPNVSPSTSLPSHSRSGEQGGRRRGNREELLTISQH